MDSNLSSPIPISEYCTGIPQERRNHNRNVRNPYRHVSSNQTGLIIVRQEKNGNNFYYSNLQNCNKYNQYTYYIQTRYEKKLKNMKFRKNVT